MCSFILDSAWRPFGNSPPVPASSAPTYCLHTQKQIVPSPSVGPTAPPSLACYSHVIPG